mmetsp:Transcript_110188/g.312561  ORF Transcript_110188/g.312561 Transcript_110188/m.312561 type:complete len:210 (-) Transcript_110188:123-752(-)
MERAMVERHLREWAANVRDPNEMTLYLQRLPTGLSKAKLQSIFDLEGFGDAYDYLHMPMCFHTKRGKGYAFINFTNEDMAQLFSLRMDGLPMGDGCYLSITPSKTQGLGDNLVIWARSQSRRVRNPDFLPFVRALQGLGMVHPSELWLYTLAQGEAGPRGAAAQAAGEAPEALEDAPGSACGPRKASAIASAILSYGLAHAIVLDRFSV